MVRILAFLAVIFGALMGSLSGHAQELEKVAIKLKWFNQFQFAGYYAAKEKGFYRAEGLDVEIIERDPKLDNVKEVLSGKAQYGVADAGLLLARLQGKPVVLLAQIFQHSPLVFLTLRESGLRTPFDLLGKTVMTESAGDGDAPLNAMILNTLGDLDKVKWKKHSYQFEELIDGRVDAMFAYLSNEPQWYRRRGKEVNIIDPRDYGIDFYGDNLFTGEQEIKDHPARVEKFRRASLKGWKYALQNKEEIVDLILAKYNSQKLTRDHLLFEASETEKIVNPRFVEIGHFEDSRFQKIAGIYTQLGLAKKFAVDPNFYYIAAKPQVTLNAEETAWINNHPKIRVHNETGWPPFNFAKNGIPQGYSIEFMNLVASKVGLEIDYVTGPTWNQFLTMMKRGDLDVMLNIVQTPDRLKYLTYIQQYASNPNTILSRKDTPYASLADLAGKTVAVPRGFYQEEILKRDFPQIKLHLVDDALSGMKAVSFGQADATVGEFAIFNYLIENELMTGLSMSGELKMGAADLDKLWIATRKDLPVLASILNKAMSAVTRDEKQVLISRWIGSNESQQVAPDTTSATETSTSVLFLLSFSIILLLVFGIIGFVLSRLMKDREISTYFGSPGFRIGIMAGLSILVAAVAIMNWLAVTDSKKRAVEAIGEELQIVLDSSIERLNIWVSQKEAFLRQLGRDPELVKITKKLLSVNRERDAL
jgi:ABC-type nitrate/sulfonate/bicarbonate transport system substrate-binding protein|tara:strand:- start:1286 stop:3400 length:2115 start_codon:yes stop_codon:yes gene_type:complete